MATTYIEIYGPSGSGVFASGADPQYPSYVQISGLLGLSDAVTQSPDADDALTGELALGCPSWQIDFPCITPFQESNAWDLANNNQFNVPLLSHGNFEVGIKPSGQGYKGGFTLAGLSDSSYNGTWTRDGLYPALSFGAASRMSYTNGTRYLWAANYSKNDPSSTEGHHWIFAPTKGQTPNPPVAQTSGAGTDTWYPWEAETWYGGPGEATVSPTFSDYTFDYALKGDAYIKIPHPYGKTITYFTSGMGAFWRARRLTFRYTTPTGGFKADMPYGREWWLKNGTSRRIYMGNLAIMMGQGGGYEGPSTRGIGNPTFKNPPANGGGYLGPPGLPPSETSSISTKTGFADSVLNTLYQDGIKMSSDELRGAQVPSLDRYTVNADAGESAPAGTPADQPVYMFSTGSQEGPVDAYGGNWVGFSGKVSRRDSNIKNTYVTENKCLWSFMRLGLDGPNKRDNVDTSDFPSASDPIRVMIGYGDPVNSDLFTPSVCMCTNTSLSGLINAKNTWANQAPDGYGPTFRFGATKGFGLSGHSGDWVFMDPQGGTVGDTWDTVNNTSSACGDPHIKPMFGDRYDL